MFVNYFQEGHRSSPVNLAVGRVILGTWLVWKTIWYDWSRHVETPYRALTGQHYEWAIPVSAPWILTIEKWVLIGLVGLVVLGYRLRMTATVSSLLVAHLGVVRSTLVTAGETSSLFIGSFFLLFFALYAETDQLSLDGLRRTGNQSITSLTARLKSEEDHRFRMPALKYSLLYLAILFFSTGLSKVVDGNGLGFVAPDNLTRLILIRSHLYPWYDFQLIVVDYPILAVLGGIGTLVLELGTIFAVLFGTLFTPFVLGLAAFTLTNAVLLGIFFADNLFFLSLLVAWDRGYSRLVLDRELCLVFDEHCHFCARSLYPFKLLDINRSVTFHSQYDVPDRYRGRADVDFEEAMYVFHGAETYEGYDAFRELLRQYRVFLPLVWLMGLPPVRTIGERVYRNIAANRGRYFTCRVPDSGENRLDDQR